MLISLRFQNWLRFSNRLHWVLFKRFPPGIDHILLLAAPLLVYDFLWVVKSSGDPPGWEITWMAVRALLLQQFRRVNNFSANAEFCFLTFWTSQGKVTFKPASSCLCSYFFLYSRSCSCWRCHLLLSNLFYLVTSIFCFPPGLQHEGIFRVSGSQVEVNDIKNAFERGKGELLKYPRNYCQFWILCECSELAWMQLSLLFVPLIFVFSWVSPSQTPPWCSLTLSSQLFAVVLCTLWSVCIINILNSISSHVW